MFFCDFFGATEVFSVGDDAFLELRRVSGCGGIVRSCGGGLATRQAGNVLLGGASGAGPEPELHGAGVSRFSENGSHLAEADAGESHAGQVDGPGSSGNAGIGSYLEATDAAESHAGWVEGPGSSGNTGTGSHLVEVNAAEGHAGQVDGPGMSGNAENGSHPAAADFSNEPRVVMWRHTPPRRTESGLLSYGTASPDSSVQKTALWRTRGSS